MTFYVELIRNTPFLLQLYFFFFGLPSLGVRLSPNSAALLTMVINLGAYATEIVRAGIESISHGQIEAGRAFGMRPGHVFLRIHLPQAWRVALPSLNNLWQNLLKDTSLVSVLGLQELMEKANIGAQVTRAPFTFFLVAAFLYLLLLAGSTPVFHALERFSSRGVLRR